MMQTNRIYGQMQAVAKALDETLNITGEPRVGFVVLVFNEDQGASFANYVSNCDRTTVVAAMREVADRIERKQFERTNEN